MPLPQQGRGIRNRREDLRVEIKNSMKQSNYYQIPIWGTQKLYSAQQMYGDHNKWESSHQEKEKEQGEQDPMRQTHAPLQQTSPCVMREMLMIRDTPVSRLSWQTQSCWQLLTRAGLGFPPGKTRTLYLESQFTALQRLRKTNLLVTKCYMIYVITGLANRLL